MAATTAAGSRRVLSDSVPRAYEYRPGRHRCERQTIEGDCKRGRVMTDEYVPTKTPTINARAEVSEVSPPRKERAVRMNNAPSSVLIVRGDRVQAGIIGHDRKRFRCAESALFADAVEHDH